MSWQRWVTAGTVGVIVVASGGYAVAQAGDGGPTYATASATKADVQRTLSLSGTVAASRRRDLSFGVSGTLTRVPVRAGERVHAGQVVARLDATSFDASVTSATATLAKAKAQLASDEDAQSTTVTTSASTTTKKKAASKKPTSTSAGTPSGTSSTTTGTSSSSATLTALKSQQQAVTTASSSATAAITAAKAALADQQQKCAAASSAGSTDDNGGAGGSTTGTTPGTTTGDAGTNGTTGGASDTSGISADCTQALAAVQSAQDAVATQQDALQQALTTLAGTLEKATTASSHTTQSSGGTQSGSQSGGAQSQQPSAASAGTGSGGGSGSAGSSGSSGSSQGAVTAARLAQDQADIDTAAADLTTAQSQRDSATLTAPYAGRIVQVPVKRTDAVGSSDIVAVLIGKGVTTVTTTVTAAQRPDVRVGQSATVLPAGATESLEATVSAIGLLPDSSSVYPVTLTVATDRTVAEGSTVSIALVTGLARDAVTVPTSAVTRTGTGSTARSSVLVVSNGTATRTQVTLGVVGSSRTSITRGLRTGQSVVLADLGATVPTSTTTTGNRLGGAGGFGGGGFGGAPGGPGGR